ncbi:hypothetical protein GCM10020218_090760 [Dactylosporangium vinaceum]
MLAGLAESTMSRDDGWRFLVLGRSLERVDMTRAAAVDPDAHLRRGHRLAYRAALLRCR